MAASAAFQPGRAGLDDHGQYAVDRAHLPRQRQLADKGGIGRRAIDLPPRRHQRYQDGQIVERALLAHVRRGQIDRDVRKRESVAAVFDGRLHPLTGLRYRGIGQADDIKPVFGAGNVRLHLHGEGVHAENTETFYF